MTSAVKKIHKTEYDDLIFHLKGFEKVARIVLYDAEKVVLRPVFVDTWHDHNNLIQSRLRPLFESFLQRDHVDKWLQVKQRGNLLYATNASLEGTQPFVVQEYDALNQHLPNLVQVWIPKNRILDFDK